MSNTFRPLTPSHLPIALAAWALIAIAGAAQAQPATTPPADTKPLLQGPSVKDNSLPGERGTFTKGGDKGKFASRPIPHPLFMRAIHSLSAEDTPPGTRMTSEQESQIKSIDDAFRASQRTYLEKHKGEVRELAAKLPPEDRARIREMMTGAPAGGEGKKAANGKVRDGLAKRLAGEELETRKPVPAPRDGPRDEMMDPDAKPSDAQADTPKLSEKELQAARDKMRKIYEAGPKPDEARAKIWAILTDPQHKAVEGQLKKVREEAQQREMNGPAEKRLEKKFEGKLGDKANKAVKTDKAADAPADKSIEGPALTLDDPRIPERIRERLKNLPADQQQDALKKLQERAKERGPERGKGKGKPRPEPKKPAPTVDDLNLPNPDSQTNPK